MVIDATFWVAVSFVIFFGALIYLKIPQKVTEMLDKMISDIKNEIDESEKLRTEAKTLLDNAQKKLDTAKNVKNEILDQAGVQNVANLPTLDEARANIVGILNAPASKLVSILLARSEKMSNLPPENSETQPKE